MLRILVDESLTGLRSLDAHKLGLLIMGDIKSQVGSGRSRGFHTVCRSSPPTGCCASTASRREEGDKECALRVVIAGRMRGAYLIRASVGVGTVPAAAFRSRRHITLWGSCARILTEVGCRRGSGGGLRGGRGCVGGKGECAGLPTAWRCLHPGIGSADTVTPHVAGDHQTSGHGHQQGGHPVAPGHNRAAGDRADGADGADATAGVAVDRSPAEQRNRAPTIRSDCAHENVADAAVMTRWRTWETDTRCRDCGVRISHNAPE